MKKIFVLFWCGVLSLNVRAGELGLGLSIKSDEDEVYIPYALSESLRLEGVVSVNESNQTSSSSSSNYDYHAIGAGLFKTARSFEHGTYYYGVRIAYMRTKQEVGSSNYDNKGYYLAPVIGYEYFIGEQFSIGADVGYIYTHWKGDSDGSYFGEELRFYGRRLEKSFLVRYYF